MSQFLRAETGVPPPRLESGDRRLVSRVLHRRDILRRKRSDPRCCAAGLAYGRRQGQGRDGVEKRSSDSPSTLCGP